MMTKQRSIISACFSVKQFTERSTLIGQWFRMLVERILRMEKIKPVVISGKVPVNTLYTKVPLFPENIPSIFIRFRREDVYEQSKEEPVQRNRFQWRITVNFPNPMCIDQDFSKANQADWAGVLPFFHIKDGYPGFMNEIESLHT
jgi:hypothetical protein